MADHPQVTVVMMLSLFAVEDNLGNYLDLQIEVKLALLDSR